MIRTIHQPHIFGSSRFWKAKIWWRSSVMSLVKDQLVQGPVVRACFRWEDLVEILLKWGYPHSWMVDL